MACEISEAAAKGIGLFDDPCDAHTPPGADKAKEEVLRCRYIHSQTSRYGRNEG